MDDMLALAALLSISLAAQAPADSITTALVSQLTSNNQGEWREAQLRLANQGPGMLPLLDRSLRSDPVRMAPRIRSLLAAAMLQSVRVGDLARDSALMAIVAEDLAQGSRIEAVLERQHVVIPATPVEGVPDTIVEGAFAVVRHLQGFAVPAGERLCASSKPVARAYGIGVLETVRANIDLQTIRRMQADRGAAYSQGDDWGGDVELSRTASNALVQMEGWERPALKIRQAWIAVTGYERFPDTIVYQHIEGVAQSSDNWDAPSAEAWWTLARPAWTEWWRAAGDSKWPPDLDAWALWVSQHRH